MIKKQLESVALAFALFALASAPAATLATDKAPTIAAIPAGLPENQAIPLRKQLAELADFKAAFGAAMDNYNHTPRTAIVVGSAQEANLNRQIEAVNQARVDYIAAVNGFNRDVALAAEGLRVIKAMKAYASQIAEWSEQKKARVGTALGQLGADGDPDATRGQIRETWARILARDPARGLAAEAAAGDGPGFPGAGTQSHEDCAVFALANAAGRPYGLVAASAAELIRNATWRPADERAAPEQAIARLGLNGGEVIILAETFGQATVVSSADFAKLLQGGNRILANVVPASGDLKAGHEIVLTKTFQHDGDTWFAVMDSNQAPGKLLYLSTHELGTILQENGVMFQAEPNRTSPLLREGKN
jgi:hypothetical protein